MRMGNVLIFFEKCSQIKVKVDRNNNSEVQLFKKLRKYSYKVFLLRNCTTQYFDESSCLHRLRNGSCFTCSVPITEVFCLRCFHITCSAHSASCCFSTHVVNVVCLVHMYMPIFVPSAGQMS